MLHRLRQFKTALRAKISTQEEAWVRQVLPPRLAELFFAMDLPDQRHCLDVASYLGPGLETSKDTLALLQAALLHDCGKAGANLTIARRCLLVVGTSLLGLGVNRFARQGKGWRNTLWNHLNHPELGAALAQDAGASPQVVELIAKHQFMPCEKSSRAQKLLYKADQAN